MISEERKAYNKKYYEENKERLRAQQKEYWENTREERVKVNKAYYEKNKSTVREKQVVYNQKNADKIRDRKLRKLGWNQDLYDSKFLEQEGLCAICKIPTAPLCLGGFLAADHEHVDPPKPRGLLCSRCNTGLGQFLDNPLLLIEAAMYLAKYGVRL